MPLALSASGDSSPHTSWDRAQHRALCGSRARWRQKLIKMMDRVGAAWRNDGARRERGQRSGRRRRASARVTVARACACAMVVWAVRWMSDGRAVSRRRHALSARRADRALESWSGAEGGDGRRAKKLSCGDLDAGDRGRFEGPNRRYRPRRVSSAGRRRSALDKALGRGKAAKTVLLTGVHAHATFGVRLLEEFLTHYVDYGKIPAENVFMVVHVGEASKSRFGKFETVMKKRGVTYSKYWGETLLHSDLSRYWQRQLAGVACEEDWVILADIDEHLFVPEQADLGSEKYSIPAFLARADALGFELVNGVWFDRISSDGSLVEREAETSLHKSYPRKCHVGPACDVRRSPPNTNGAGQVLPREGMVIAHKLKFDVADVRALHDFAHDDVVPATALDIRQDNIFPVPISVQHYQWHEGAVEQLYQVASAYEACGLEDARKATSDLATTLKEAKNVVSDKTCPELACSEASSDVVALDVRRIAIVTTVWEHVDGVSRTMKRFASYLRDRDDASVLVMSPDLAERDYVEANNYHSVHQLVAPVPAVEVPGRPEYKMAAPLQARQRAVLEAYNPHVVHVAAPDMLGHSAVRWAREVGACSVCSYHTAFDTYMQYYRVRLLTHPIQHLLKDFYSMCDVVAVPTYAAANHLRSIGIPGEKMGFFPRGVNQTLYNPSMRDDEYRRDVFGASSDDIVILWVARIVREKGLGSFVKTIQSLNKVAQREADLPKFRVVVAGDGPDLAWVRSSLKQFENVVILGHKGGTNLAKTYAAGDIFFFPSKTEVIPNNLIEAMASGLPVITDDVGVNRAIVQDEVSGIIVKNTAPLPGDVTNYVNAIRRLMKDRELAKRMSAAAVASTSGLTWKRTFESLLHAYDRCRPGLPYARHIPRESLDQPKLFPPNVEAMEKRRDVIVDDGAPENSLLYRISRGITGGYVRSLDEAKRDDDTIASHGVFERKR